MLYKTIILRLLEDHPVIHERLRMEQALLPTLEHQARQLKARHEELLDLFSLTSPGIAASQTTEAAMEMAVSELEQRLANDSLPPEVGPLSLDAAMEYLRRHSQPA
jgi:hypothetical protein